MLTPDFLPYSDATRVTSAEQIPLGIRLCFDDGSTGEIHHLSLRENGEEALHQVTREQVDMLTAIPADTQARQTEITAHGDLRVYFEPEGRWFSYQADWLKQWSQRSGPDWLQLPQHQPWAADCDLSEMSYQSESVLHDQQTRQAWLTSLLTRGFALISGLPAEPASLQTMTDLLGPVRSTNFGTVFDVRVKDDANSNAYTDMALPVHNDLPTREYQPGIQWLFCLESNVSGAETILVDGAELVQQLAKANPDVHQTLCEPLWLAVDRSKTSDYRQITPVISYDRSGQLSSLRLNPWLRAPIQQSLADTDRAYRALRAIMVAAESSDLQQRFALQPGQLLVFNNRRILHGRTGFSKAEGSRWLQGCYSELDELHSAWRMSQRESRA